MALEVDYFMRLIVEETVNMNQDHASDPVIIHELATRVRGKATGSTSADAGTSGPVTKVYAEALALSSGTITINLTSLAHSAGGDVTQTVTFDGLKVQFYLFENDGDNANPMTITGGASDPFEIFSSDTSGTITLQPGDAIMGFLPETTADVASNVDQIDVTGTGSQILNVILVAG